MPEWAGSAIAVRGRRTLGEGAGRVQASGGRAQEQDGHYQASAVWVSRLGG